MADEPAAPDRHWTRLPWHSAELPVRGWPANWDCWSIDQRCFEFCGHAGVWQSPSHHASSASMTGLGARAAATERLLCDLERGGVVDLLPDRERTTVESWLRLHPGI